MLKLSENEETRALSLHNTAIVVDAHSDLPFDLERRVHIQQSPMKSFHLPRWRTGGVDVVVCALTWDGTRYYGELKRALKSLDLVQSEVKANSNDVTIVQTVADIYQAKKEGKVSLLLGCEGGKPLEGDLSFLRIFYELGLRYLGISWHHRNQLADGVKEPTNGGLSEFGQEVVAEANRLGILLDVSHLSEQGFWDVLGHTKSPIMASHSNTRAICDVPRNLTDEQIIALAENGGVIGLVFNGRYIDPNLEQKKRTTLNTLLDHLDYLVGLVGVNCVGLGPDFMDFITDYVNPIIQKAENLPLDEWTRGMADSARWFTNNNIIKYPEGLENISKLPNITRGLIKRGYSDLEIEKILGGNFLRLFETIIG
jgi:membrane dipeptidase